MSEAIHAIASFLVDTVGEWGYLGIFILMFIESTFIPFPSEIVMIPAGYLAYQGKMNLIAVILTGTLGSIAGALVNYYLALKVGRGFLLRYGKYLSITPQTLQKLEVFFQKHGEISTFNGRLIPGIRQLISIPAGLSRMRLQTFILYTTLGAGIWVAVLSVLGYVIGSNQTLIEHYLNQITLIALGGVVVITLWYLYRHKSNQP